MLSRCRPLEIWCDAPPYGVVRACEGCGFRSPLDVRWCRMSRFLKGENQAYFVRRLWHWLFGRSRHKQQVCTCGQPLPDLKKYEFTFVSQKVADYHLAQCRQCRTIFWEAAVPLPAWMEEGAVG